MVCYLKRWLAFSTDTRSTRYETPTFLAPSLARNVICGAQISVHRNQNCYLKQSVYLLLPTIEPFNSSVYVIECGGGIWSLAFSYLGIKLPLLIVSPQEHQDRRLGVGRWRGLVGARLLQQHPWEGASFWGSGGLKAEALYGLAGPHPQPTREQGSAGDSPAPSLHPHHQTLWYSISGHMTNDLAWLFNIKSQRRERTVSIQ